MITELPHKYLNLLSKIYYITYCFIYIYSFITRMIMIFLSKHAVTYQKSWRIDTPYHRIT